MKKKSVPVKKTAPKKVIKKDDARGDMITKLADMQFRGKVDLVFLSEQLRTPFMRKGVVKVLTKHGIDPELVKENICRSADEKQRSDWHSLIRTVNANPKERLRYVLVGNPEFDPSVRLETAGNPQKEARQDDSTDKTTLRPFGIREELGDAKMEVKESYRWSSKNPPIAQPLQKKEKELEMAPVSTRGQQLFGVKILGLIRWLANKGWSYDEIKTLMAKNRITMKQHTVKLQYGAGKNGRTHYGPLPIVMESVKKKLAAERKSLSGKGAK